MEDSLRRKARDARMQIATGALRGARLLEQLLAVPVLDRDAWVDELLEMEPPPPDVGLPHGAVPYLPCGVDEILALVREVPVTRDDELVDLGSGLGRVVILAHLLTGARARGIEIQAHLVDSSIARATALGAREVSFIRGDAAQTDLDGSIFFLYAPCTGDLLARMIRRLEPVARRRRSIFACTVGVDLGEVPWLTARPAISGGLAIYDAQS